MGISAQSIQSAQRVRNICQLVSRNVYSRIPPSEAYSERTMRYLFMVAAHESWGFHYRRQRGYGRHASGGAFGLWQLEQAWVHDAQKWLRTHEECLDRVWAVGSCEMALRPIADVLYVIQEPEGDTLCCALARIGTFSFPPAIPALPIDQAAYAKKYHNSIKGKATPGMYLAAYNRWWPLTEAKEV